MRIVAYPRETSSDVSIIWASAKQQDFFLSRKIEVPDLVFIADVLITTCFAVISEASEAGVEVEYVFGDGAGDIKVSMR